MKPVWCGVISSGVVFVISNKNIIIIVEKNKMSLLITLLLNRERAHNKSIIHVINRKSKL
jgi:hypothetical protein